MPLRRRKFLQIGATAAAAGPIISCTANKSPWRFFTVEEARILEAMVDRIVPADQDPGAAWAGVVLFIDRQLMGFHKPHQPAYRKGLAEVGKGFADLTPEQRDAALSAMDQKGAPLKPFFDLVVQHTMQGFYGTPRHGGNRDAVSWRMLGVPVPPVRGRAS